MKKETLEKYSERFDNDKSTIGNPDTWGKRIVQENIYTGKEVEYLLSAFKNYLGFGDEVNEEKWFNQFKKEIKL